MATKVCEDHHEREMKMGFVLVCARGSLYSTVCLPTALTAWASLSVFIKDLKACCSNPVIPALVKHLIIIPNISMEKLRH